MFSTTTYVYVAYVIIIIICCAWLLRYLLAPTQTTLVYFYMPNCPSCKSFGDKMAKICSKYDNPSVVSIDCTNKEAKDQLLANGVSTVPALFEKVQSADNTTKLLPLHVNGTTTA